MVDRVGVDSREARRVRLEALTLHTRLAGSQSDLRRRVTALIKPFNDDLEFADTTADEMIAAGDGRDLFYEQLKQIHLALKTVRPEDLDDETLNEVLTHADRLMGAIQRAAPRIKKGLQI